MPSLVCHLDHSETNVHKIGDTTSYVRSLRIRGGPTPSDAERNFTDKK